MFEPKYYITHNILSNIGKIDAAREVIDHAALVPSWEARFKEDAVIRTVHHGTKLEGNQLSKEQAEKLLRSGETQAELAAQKTGVVGRDRDIQEVINYRSVLDWIEGQDLGSIKKKGYTEEILGAIHKLTVNRILAEDQAGLYRVGQAVVVNSKTEEETFKPPPGVEVPYQMEDFFEWLNSDEGKLHHPILRAGVIHYELVRIHPFVDGNGRMARAMALMLLSAEGYNVKRFFSLESYFDKNASSYYQALQSVGEGEGYDLTYWLEYFTFGLSVELDQVKQEVLKLSRDLRLKSKIGYQVALSERQIKILETMQNSGGRVRSNVLEKVLPAISIDTILRDIKDLIAKGLIKKHGMTKGAYYVVVE